MKIQTIHYERLVGLPNYSNLKVRLLVGENLNPNLEEEMDRHVKNDLDFYK